MAKAKKSSKKSVGKKKAGVLKVDMRKEESGGGRFRVAEGDYRFKLKKVESGTSENSGNPMLIWYWEGVEGKVEGKILKDYTTLTPKSLWKVRSILEALGMDVPKKVISIPLKKLVGKEVGITLGDDEPYEGKIKSRAMDYIDIETFESSDVDDEDEDEDDDDDEDEDEEDDDEDDDDDEEEVSLEDLDEDEL